MWRKAREKRRIEAKCEGEVRAKEAEKHHRGNFRNRRKYLERESISNRFHCLLPVFCPLPPLPEGPSSGASAVHTPPLGGSRPSLPPSCPLPAPPLPRRALHRFSCYISLSIPKPRGLSVAPRSSHPPTATPLSTPSQRPTGVFPLPFVLSP